MAEEDITAILGIQGYFVTQVTHESESNHLPLLPAERSAPE